jgi:hypothetical protein
VVGNEPEKVESHAKPQRRQEDKEEESEFGSEHSSLLSSWRLCGLA